MTLAQIMALALRQLDEDAQDIAEYDMAFRVYANAGYEMAVCDYLKPREHIALRTDEHGEAQLDGTYIRRVIETRRRSDGREIAFCLAADGRSICTQEKNAAVDALCEVVFAPLQEETDEPRLPERVHNALADYICYRHLISGSLAKQSRAQAFLASYYKAMELLRPQGMGSAKRWKNLYAATDLRYRA